MKPYTLLYGPERRLGMFVHWGLYARLNTTNKP